MNLKFSFLKQELAAAVTAFLSPSDPEMESTRLRKKVAVTILTVHIHSIG